MVTKPPPHILPQRRFKDSVWWLGGYGCGKGRSSEAIQLYRGKMPSQSWKGVGPGERSGERSGEKSGERDQKKMGGREAQKYPSDDSGVSVVRLVTLVKIGQGIGLWSVNLTPFRGLVDWDLCTALRSFWNPASLGGGSNSDLFQLKIKGKGGPLLSVPPPNCSHIDTLAFARGEGAGRGTPGW